VALDLLYTMGFGSVPVIGGYNKPMIYSNMYPYAWRTCADGAWQQTLKPSPYKAVNATVTAWLTGVLSNNTDVETLLIGGGTTFGHVVQEIDPTLLPHITRWVVMGGNILPQYAGVNGSDGNINPIPGITPYHNTVAEWNIFVDVLAAGILINNTDLNIVMVALNACNHVPLNASFLNYVRGVTTLAGKLAYGVVDSECVYQNKSSPFPELHFWDPLAAIALTTPELLEYKEWPVYVQRELVEDNDTSGQLIVDAKYGTPRVVAMWANSAGVFDTYVAVINSTAHRMAK
jgi:purine nucleosidase